MKIQVGGGAVVAAAGIVVAGVGVWMFSKKVGQAADAVGETVGKVVDAVNPASSTNLVYQAAQPYMDKQVGGYAWTDYYFAANDLLNPWNESDVYARIVWGLD